MTRGPGLSSVHILLLFAAAAVAAAPSSKTLRARQTTGFITSVLLRGRARVAPASSGSTVLCAGSSKSRNEPAEDFATYYARRTAAAGAQESAEASVVAGVSSHWQMTQGNMAWTVDFGDDDADELDSALPAHGASSGQRVPMFMIELSKGWDGAKQELATVKAAIRSVAPHADIKVAYAGTPEVHVSLLEWDKADPAFLMCLPEVDRWRMVPRSTVFKAPQMQLYSKFPDLKIASMASIKEGCGIALQRLQ